mgnify:CR=1 FL=1
MLTNLDAALRDRASRHTPTNWWKAHPHASRPETSTWVNEAPKPHVHGVFSFTADYCASLLSDLDIGVAASGKRFAVDGSLVDHEQALQTLRERATALLDSDELPTDLPHITNGLRHTVYRLNESDRYANSVLRKVRGDIPAPAPAPKPTREERLAANAKKYGDDLQAVTEILAEESAPAAGTTVLTSWVSEVSEFVHDEKPHLFKSSRSGAHTTSRALVAGGAAPTRVYSDGVRSRGYNLPETFDRESAFDAYLQNTHTHRASQLKVTSSELLSKVENPYRRSA